MSEILQYWLTKQASLPTKNNPFLPPGALVVKPSEVIMASGTTLSPHGVQNPKRVGEQLPPPEPKRAKIDTKKTHPLAIIS